MARWIRQDMHEGKWATLEVGQQVRGDCRVIHSQVAFGDLCIGEENPIRMRQPNAREHVHRRGVRFRFGFARLCWRFMC